MASLFTKERMIDLAKRYDAAGDAAVSCGVKTSTIARAAKKHGIVFRSARKRVY
jgi:hypothetical protein